MRGLRGPFCVLGGEGVKGSEGGRGALYPRRYTPDQGWECIPGAHIFKRSDPARRVNVQAVNR